MGNLTKLNWPGGFYPSQDTINGNPDTLLRADNLQQEQDGSIGLCRSDRHITSFNDVITGFHSKVYNGIEFLYAGIGNCQSVRAFYPDGSPSFDGDIISNAQGRPVFGDAYGLVLACAGAQRNKFNGATVYKLGLETPTIPIRSRNPVTNVVETFIENSTAIDIIPRSQAGGVWVFDEGTEKDTNETGAELYPDATTNRGVVSCAFDPPLDVLNIAAEQSANPGNDSFFMDVQLDDPNAFSSIRVQLNLDAIGQNYYWYEWIVPGSTEFSLGRDAWSKISASRSQFNRQGSDVTLDWRTVSSIQITINAVSSTAWVGISDPRFIGGITGQLLGSYQFIYRWVKDMGTYLAKSPFSPVSETFTVVNGSIFILPANPLDQSEASGLQFCTVEIYRRSVPSTESYFNSLTGAFTQLPDILDQFYLVGSYVPGAYFQDTTGDVQVLELDTPANTFLDSIQNIPEPIIDIIGIYNDRVLYLTGSSLYLSERLDPDCFDVRYTLKFTGDPYDTNFWIKAINNATLMLGTNHDLYEISGTLLDLPDGTLDINVYAFGDAYPPISLDVAKIDGLLFYVAADGVRTTSGSNSSLLSPHLSQLFQGIDCHGVPAIQIFGNGIQRYYLTVGHGKLYIALPHTDGLRRLFIYDLIKKVWTMRSTYVTGCYTTATDQVLFAIGPECLIADDGNSYDNTASGVGQSINLLTVYDHDGTPRNRKDTETLKLVIDTGGQNLDVYLGVMKADGTHMNFVETINTSSLQTVYISLKNPTLSLGFRYALNLIGSSLKRFQLVEYTIEYLPRPEQINYVRIPNSNLGSTARKRFISIPFVIDTLGVAVTITPIIDNLTHSSEAQSGMLSLDQKQTLNFFFQGETVGTDIGFIIEGDGPFELTGPDYAKAVSEAMPAPAEFLVIPPNDFGTPNRKRATSIKFELNTEGQSVAFIPIVDGVSYPEMDVNSGVDKKAIFEYFFDIALGDFTWFMLGGTLRSRTPTPFEMYGELIPQNLEVFPPRLKSLYLAENNYGAAARKRLRTLPIIINTNGSNVTYQPYVDGVAYPPTILNSAKKATLYHFFATDSFGIDYAGFLSGSNPFEFYEMATPASVEVLPVPKKFDQLGPLRFDKIGKLFALRLRVVLVGSTTSIPFSIYGDDQEMDPTYDAIPKYSGEFNITPGEDVVVQANLPKSVNSTIFRITLGPTVDAFHRFDLQAKIQASGMETDAKWVPIR